MAGIENTGVLSLDAFFGIPDFRMKEKVMNMVVALRSLAEKTVMIQTRKPEEKVFEWALKGNISDFYREEIAERKQFGYPPFNTFIKLTLQGNKADIRKKMEQAESMLKPYEVNIFEAFHRGVDRSYILHGLIIIPRDKWVDKNLLEKLRMLSPEFAIHVDPENLL
jgi:primosomal protein N' (replication factor Y)